MILGISDLSRGVDVMEQRAGVRAAYGGAHPGGGTHNALLSLGDGRYLEIIAPNLAENEDSPMVEELQDLESLTPISWAVAVTNIEPFRRNMQARGLRLSEPQQGRRERPDGTVLEWVTFSVVEPSHPLAPFFIHWADGTAHPSTTSPAGCTLESLRLEDPDPRTLRTIIDPLRLAVNVLEGKQWRIRIVLSCPGGRMEF